MSESKTILITGATSGIGLETARFLHNKGYKLVLVGRDKAKIQNILKELSDSFGFVIDLEKTEMIESIFEYCKSLNLKLDGLVHAAGYTVNTPVRSYKIEHMERQMKLHYYAFLELCKSFYNKSISNQFSSIVVTSSLASITKLKGSVLYASSKSALNSAVSVISKEFIKRFIRVNAIMPAYVDTRMNEGLDEIIDIKAKQPMGMIPPHNIAEIIEFLLSDKSKYMTGALIPISAGMEF